MKLLSFILLPLAWIYGLILSLRHLLYDLNILRSSRGELPTIVIGNLHLGGTGKTPHAEYILRLLRDLNPALLSRGYGRKTHGYLLAGETDDATSIGDEPAELHAALPGIPLAVCEDRLTGISLLKKETDARVVVLDDAFQHRKLQPHLSLLLMDYGRPIWKEQLVPSGRLRDVKQRMRKADILIVTKCPPDLSDNEMESFRQKLRVAEHQHLFFTTIVYGELIHAGGPSLAPAKGEAVAGLAGLANPRPFRDFLESSFNLKKFKEYPDHHTFSPSEIRSLELECDKFAPPVKAIITTRKDAMRIRAQKVKSELPLFFLPVEVKFLSDEEKFKHLLRRLTENFIEKT